MEKELNFLGLMVLENRLKAETIPIIRELQAAAVRTIMVTGDNMLTALSVAYDCHMVQPQEHVILAQVVPDIGPDGASSKPQLRWTYTENAHKKVSEVCTTAHAVRIVLISAPCYAMLMHLDGFLQDSVSVEIDESEKFHFAITGKSWALLRQYYPHVIPKVGSFCHSWHHSLQLQCLYGFFFWL